MGWFDENFKIDELIGKTVMNIEGLEVGSEEVTFTCSDDTKYSMRHERDCCESVTIEDIIGNPDYLLNWEILQAEESTSKENPPGTNVEYQDSFTWTFYRIATNRGLVVIRWYGESNGYYSESVDFVKL